MELYSWTDKQGKKWNYARRRSASCALNPDAPDRLRFRCSRKGVDAGDKVRFERQSPFGPIKWEKTRAI